MCFPNKFACNHVSIFLFDCEWVYMKSHWEPQMIALFYWAIGPSIFFGTSFDWPCAAKNGIILTVQSPGTPGIFGVQLHHPKCHRRADLVGRSMAMTVQRPGRPLHTVPWWKSPYRNRRPRLYHRLFHHHGDFSNS